MKWNKKILLSVVLLVSLVSLSACQSMTNWLKNTKEEWIGLEMTVRTFDENSQLIDEMYGKSLSISRNQEAANVVGSNFAADIFVGRITATGSLSVYFQDAVFRNYFDNEDKISIVVALTTGEEKDAEAKSFTMGKVKINSGSKTDAELGLTQSMDFQALQNDVVAGGLIASTILVQDTTLV